MPVELSSYGALYPQLTTCVTQSRVPHWTDGEILRALREGVDRNGHKLFMMSNIFVRHMSDEDLQAVIAYMRSQPAMDNKTQDPPNLHPAAKLLPDAVCMPPCLYGWAAARNLALSTVGGIL